MNDLQAQGKMVKAGQQYRSEDGVVYTVLSNRMVKARCQVRAYTFDLSVWAANGDLDGQPCHFADVLDPVQFVRQFSEI